MTDRRLSPRYFDNARALVSTRFQTVNGEDLAAGATISDDLTHTMRLRLWMSRRAVYADQYSPTVEAEAPDVAWQALAQGWYVAEGENGYYRLVPESGLDENGEPTEDALAVAEIVHGVDAAEIRVAELREIVSFNGVEMAKGGGGWYSISAPWLDEPVRVQGADAAIAKRTEIAEAGAPEGWTPGGEQQAPEGEQKPESKGEGETGGESQQSDPAGEQKPEDAPADGEATHEAPAIVEGAIVTQTAEGAPLNGILATVAIIDNGEAAVVWFVGEGEAAEQHEATIPVADLVLAPGQDEG